MMALNGTPLRIVQSLPDKHLMFLWSLLSHMASVSLQISFLFFLRESLWSSVIQFLIAKSHQLSRELSLLISF